MGARVPSSFYARGAETVAREALGKILVSASRGRAMLARIVETEAYVGEHDLACHASKGRTRRTEVMFGPPGHAYVYLIYGMYHMLNLVTGQSGEAQAVLVRAAEPCEPIVLAGEGDSVTRAAIELREEGLVVATPTGDMNGPGKLSRALGITLRDNGVNLCGSRLYLRDGRPPNRVGVGPRVGVDYARDWADAPLRFYDGESPAVSRPRAKKRP